MAIQLKINFHFFFFFTNSYENRQESILHDCIQESGSLPRIKLSKSGKSEISLFPSSYSLRYFQTLKNINSTTLPFNELAFGGESGKGVKYPELGDWKLEKRQKFISTTNNRKKNILKRLEHAHGRFPTPLERATDHWPRSPG